MSIWELEALAEESVQLVHKSSETTAQKRNLYASIFETVEGFDVGFTHFRTVAELTAAEFFFRIDVRDHPEWKVRQDEFESLVDEGESRWIDDDDGVEGLYEPEDGEHPAGIWFDARMALWNKAVEAGLLQGLSAEPVAMLSPVETLATLMTIAGRDPIENAQVLAMLHGFLAWPGEELLREGDPRLAPLLEIPGLKEALNQKHEDWVAERFDARNFLEWADSDEDEAFLKWWCAPYE